MFSKCKLISLLALALWGYNAHAMKAEANFKIIVHNKYGAPIDITYTHDGKKITKKLGDNGFFTLGANTKIEGDIAISRAGAFMGYLARSWQQQKNGLWQVWDQKKKEGMDSLVLTVTSSLGGVQIVVNYSVAKEETLGLVEKFQGDVLDQFPGLVDYGLQKTLTPDQITAIRSPKEVLFPAGWYGLQGETTGEDIARYILGLPKNYDRASMDKAYRELALKWAPDKQRFEGMKEFAEKVMKLINHARDLLRDALQNKKETCG